MMKLYVSKVEDRDQMVVILARNGYTVRQGKEKDIKSNKTLLGHPDGHSGGRSGQTVAFVEVIENGK